MEKTIDLDKLIEQAQKLAESKDEDDDKDEKSLKDEDKKESSDDEEETSEDEDDSNEDEDDENDNDSKKESKSDDDDKDEEISESLYLSEDIILDLKECLGNETLDEALVNMSIGSKIRWKLAKFALRFLTEDTLNSIISGYYGKEKAANKLELKKKEKVKIVREIADKLPEDKKNQIINNEAAKKLEKSGLVSAAGGVVTAGLASGVVAVGIHGRNVTNNAKTTNYNFSDKQFDDSAKIELHNSNNKFVDNVNHQMMTREIDRLNVVTPLLSTVATVFGNIIIGAIVAGSIGLVIGAIKGGIKVRNAAALRADQISQELLTNKDNKLSESNINKFNGDDIMNENEELKNETKTGTSENPEETTLDAKAPTEDEYLGQEVDVDDVKTDEVEALTNEDEPSVNEELEEPQNETETGTSENPEESDLEDKAPTEDEYLGQEVDVDDVKTDEVEALTNEDEPSVNESYTDEEIIHIAEMFRDIYDFHDVTGTLDECLVDDVLDEDTLYKTYNILSDNMPLVESILDEGIRDRILNWRANRAAAKIQRRADDNLAQAKQNLSNTKQDVYDKAAAQYKQDVKITRQEKKDAKNNAKLAFKAQKQQLANIIKANKGSANANSIKAINAGKEKLNDAKYNKKNAVNNLKTEKERIATATQMKSTSTEAIKKATKANEDKVIAAAKAANRNDDIKHIEAERQKAAEQKAKQAEQAETLKTEKSTQYKADKKNRAKQSTLAQSNLKLRLGQLKASPDGQKKLAEIRAKNTSKPGTESKPTESKPDYKAQQKAFHNANPDPKQAAINKSIARHNRILNSSLLSDGALYGVLLNAGFNITESNLNILKEGLTSGKYVIYEEEEVLQNETETGTSENPEESDLDAKAPTEDEYLGQEVDVDDVETDEVEALTNEDKPAVNESYTDEDNELSESLFKKKSPEEKAANKAVKEEKKFISIKDKYLKKLDGKTIFGGPIQYAIDSQIGYYDSNHNRNQRAYRFEAMLKSKAASEINSTKTKINNSKTIDEIKKIYKECLDSVSAILAELIETYNSTKRIIKENNEELSNKSNLGTSENPEESDLDAKAPTEDEYLGQEVDVDDVETDEVEALTNEDKPAVNEQLSAFQEALNDIVSFLESENQEQVTGTSENPEESDLEDKAPTEDEYLGQEVDVDDVETDELEPINPNESNLYDDDDDITNEELINYIENIYEDYNILLNLDETSLKSIVESANQYDLDYLDMLLMDESIEKLINTIDNTKNNLDESCVQLTTHGIVTGLVEDLHKKERAVARYLADKEKDQTKKKQLLDYGTSRRSIFSDWRSKKRQLKSAYDALSDSDKRKYDRKTWVKEKYKEYKRSKKAGKSVLYDYVDKSNRGERDYTNLQKQQEKKERNSEETKNKPKPVKESLEHETDLGTSENPEETTLDAKAPTEDEYLGQEVDADDVKTDNLEPLTTEDEPAVNEHYTYGSLQEAAEIPVDYFKIPENGCKLQTQIACEIAKENNDLLYNELERAIATVKVLKDKIANKYGALAAERKDGFISNIQPLTDATKCEKTMFSKLGEQLEISKAKSNLPNVDKKEVIYNSIDIFDDIK